MSADTLSKRTAVCLLVVVILAWGGTWVVNKAALEYLPPIWASFLRLPPAFLLLCVLCVASGRMVIPVKADLPVIFTVGWLHMVGFSVLVSVGMQYLPAGRSVVLGYTTPLWVVPAAWLFLGEKPGLRRWLGLAVGMAGLLLILQPASMDWSNPDTLLGHAVILLAALMWAICIVYGRANRFVTPTFELLPWQLLLAGLTQLVLALIIEGMPDINWTLELVFLLGYGSVIGTALAYWAMNAVNRGLPASTTSIALLAVPVVGLLCSKIFLSEPVDATLMIATVLIISGIALGARPSVSANAAVRKDFRRE